LRTFFCSREKNDSYSAQGLLYGAFRYCRVDHHTVTTVAEGLLYADDLTERDPDGYALLVAYAASRKADVDLAYLAVEPGWQLELVSRTEFVDRWLWHVGYPHNNRLDPATIAAYNALFDLSRLTVDVADARADLYGGFSFTLWQDPDGKAAGWRPRLAVKALDLKRAIKKFRRLERRANDFGGHLLDVRTLVFALTSDSHLLDSACRAFNVKGKSQAPQFGLITEEAIDYCRQDVQATTGLLEAVLAEYARHPIRLQPTLLACVDRSGLPQGDGDLPAAGRAARLLARDARRRDVGVLRRPAEVHIRRQPMPVQVVDFTSMYPTVHCLRGIWRLVTAERLVAVDAMDEIRELLTNHHRHGLLQLGPLEALSPVWSSASRTATCWRSGPAS